MKPYLSPQQSADTESPAAPAGGLDLRAVAHVANRYTSSVKDEKAEELVDREARGFPLAQLATRYIARQLVGVVMQEAAATMAELQAKTGAGDLPADEIGRNRMANAIVWAAFRRAEKSVNLAFKQALAQAQSGGEGQ